MSSVGEKITQLVTSITNLSNKLATRKTYLESSFSSMDSNLTTAENTQVTDVIDSLFIQATHAIKNLSDAIGDNAVEPEPEPESEPEP